MDSFLEDVVLDDDGIYGALNEDYDIVSQAIDEAEDVDFGLMIDDDDEDDDILNIMGVNVICTACDDNE